jgi:hypothetical protein
MEVPMSVRAWVGIALLWLLSIFSVGSIVGAQVPLTTPVSPKVMSGADLGFRVEATQGDQVVGRVVVKVNGAWVDAVIGPPLQIKPLK